MVPRSYHLRQQRCHRLAGQAALIQREPSVLHQFRQCPQQVGDMLRSKIVLMALNFRQQRRYRLSDQTALIQREQSVLYQFCQRPQQVGDLLGNEIVLMALHLGNSVVIAWLARPS